SHNNVCCQAEDGIRDRNVTGVQTCALPIKSRVRRSPSSLRRITGRMISSPSFRLRTSTGSRQPERVRCEASMAWKAAECCLYDRGWLVTAARDQVDDTG